MGVQKLPKLSIAAYIQQERESGIKYEYHSGQIYALAGGTLNHAKLCGNSYSEIRKALENKNSSCLPFTSEAKLAVHKKNKANSFVYPDAMVVCGEIEPSELDKNAVTNPVLIVEVLSKSTSGYDRGDKFYLYRNIPSFKEYVLIAQDKHVVDVYYKPNGSDLWRITRYENLEDEIKLESLDIVITMSKLYQHIRFESK